MKTIRIQAIDREDDGVRENEVLVSRIVGWYSRSQYYDNPKWTSYKGPTTFISIDSGVEYEIAESLESFTERMGTIVDASKIFEIDAPALDAAVMEDADEEIRWAESLYEDIQTSPDRAATISIIMKRFEQAQKEHCKDSHYGECL